MIEMMQLLRGALRLWDRYQCVSHTHYILSTMNRLQKAMSNVCVCERERLREKE